MSDITQPIDENAALRKELGELVDAARAIREGFERSYQNKRFDIGDVRFFAGPVMLLPEAFQGLNQIPEFVHPVTYEKIDTIVALAAQIEPNPDVLDIVRGILLLGKGGLGLLGKNVEPSDDLTESVG